MNSIHTISLSLCPTTGCRINPCDNEKSTRAMKIFPFFGYKTKMDDQESHGRPVVDVK